MAKQAHLRVVRAGATAIAHWRTANPGGILDLRGANLTGAALDRCDLSFALLESAKLQRASLFQANLERCDLSNAALESANLRRVSLVRASLNRCMLMNAVMELADLRWADLVEANLRNARCGGADFFKADLRRAVLDGAVLKKTNLEDANLLEATFRGTVFDNTRLVNTDFSDAHELDRAVHRTQSPIDHETISTSRNLPGAFLRGCGIEQLYAREFSKAHLRPPLFNVTSSESFPDAWESFCCEVLNRHEGTTEIYRREPPENGIDLYWPARKIAYQCKSVEDVTGRFNLTRAIKSLQRALQCRRQVPWTKYVLCCNHDITGNQELKLHEVFGAIKLLTPEFWVKRCKEQFQHLGNRFLWLVGPMDRMRNGPPV
jgi:uncharacterized protein YjbI with pentapeptide repeats